MISRRISALVRGLLLPAVCASCAQLVQYTDELADERTGRSFLVTTPATIGGLCGFVAGIPVDIAAAPITYAVHGYQKAQDPVRADLASTMLFPSFVLWRAGNLVAVPFDVCEFLAFRAWRPATTMTREEREEVELWHDDQILPSYPVEPLYPGGAWVRGVRDGRPARVERESR